VRRFALLIPIFLSTLAACAPLPETSPEPIPQQQTTKPVVAPKPLPVVIVPIVIPVPAPVPVTPQPAPPPQTPPPTDSISSVGAPLPEFGNDTMASVTGSFFRADLPEALRRPIRVGIFTDRRVHHIECGEFCRITLDDGSSGRVAGSLEAQIYSGHLIFTGDGHRYLSERNLATIQAWNDGDFVRINGKSYRGILEVALTNGYLRVVNILPVEDYLRGVVPNEIGRLDSTMFEALKAQAVAARTYAYKHFNSRVSQGFDVYADVHDQVYEGHDGESALANQAIDESYGVVMQWKGSLIEAYYHSTCGGHTESMEAWNKAPVPYMQAVPDLDPQGNSWCSLSSYSTWEYHYSWSEFSRLAKLYINTASPDTLLIFNRIYKVSILDRLPGHRVGRVLFNTDRGPFIVRGDKNRWLFRLPNAADKTLPSAWFDVFQDADGLTVRGRGFGHGIGLCQMGARAMAKANIDYKEILWHYYPNVDLVKW